MPENRWLRLTERIAFGAFLVSVLTGFLVPIYTDEIGWRMQERAGLDGGVDRMLSDICGPNTMAVPPLMMMPFRTLTAWLNTAFPDPLYIRVVGVCCALVWALLFRALIGRIAVDRAQRSTLIALAFGLLGMGVLPWLMVLSRPEQPILLTSTAALLIAAIASRQTEAMAKFAWAGPVAIVLLGVAAMSYHMKGILFLPLFLVCIYFSATGKRRLTIRIVAMVVLAALAALATQYWAARFRCPGDPLLAGRLAQENIMSILANGGDWRAMAMSAIRGANPNNYIVLAEARPLPLSQWLPNFQIGSTGSFIRYLPMSLAWNAAMLVGLVCLIRALHRCWRDRRLTLIATVPLVSAGLVLVWGMSQLHKNDYEATTILPLLALFAVFSLAAVPWTPERRKQLGIAAAVIVTLSIVGQIDIAARYGPPLLRTAGHSGYIDAQHTSVPVYGYGAARAQILKTARQCGIGSSGRAMHPLVDDVTYFAFAGSYQPFHRLGVLEQWNGTIRDPIAYLKSRGSEGAIVGCRHLSPELKRQAIRNGDFCCISTR